MNNKERINATLGQLALYVRTGVFACEQDDVALFIEHFLRLEDRAEATDVWNARYHALLEECENSRPRRYGGDGDDLPYGTVVIDREGESWQRDACSGWSCTSAFGLSRLPAKHAPYTILYTPKEES